MRVCLTKAESEWYCVMTTKENQWGLRPRNCTMHSRQKTEANKTYVCMPVEKAALLHIFFHERSWSTQCFAHVRMVIEFRRIIRFCSFSISRNYKNYHLKDSCWYCALANKWRKVVRQQSIFDLFLFHYLWLLVVLIHGTLRRTSLVRIQSNGWIIFNCYQQFLRLWTADRCHRNFLYYRN